MSIILFLVVLFILILVHEWGHFITAKKTGMRVDEFGIGFPPKAAGFRRKGDETEYTLNWLPIGGFVKIWGENGEEETEGLSETERARAFGARPKWAQAIVLVAGVTMNIIFAWFLFVIINLTMIGVPVSVDESFASPEAKLTILGVVADTPAAVIPVDSTVTQISSGETVLSNPSATQFSDLVNESGGAELQITYQLNGQTETVAVTPQQGVIASDPERYAVGAQLALTEVRFKGVWDAISGSFATTWEGLLAITSGLWSLLSQVFVGEADFSQVAGPVGIVGMVGEAADYGWVALLGFTAFISLNLAIINLLPFPALDGGRLLFVAIEAVTRKKIPPEWAGRLNLAGFALLMLLMIAVTYNDIVRLL